MLRLELQPTSQLSRSFSPTLTTLTSSKQSDIPQATLAANHNHYHHQINHHLPKDSSFTFTSGLAGNNNAKMTFTLTASTILSLFSLFTLFTTLISAAPMGGGFGGFGRAAVGGPGPAVGVGFNAAPYGYGYGYNRFNNFAVYPYGYGYGFNQFNSFPYGMGFNRVNVGGGGCPGCHENKEIPIYVNNVPPPPPPNPAPVIYNEIPAPEPSPPPVIVNDIESPPPQAPPTVINNVDPNQQPNLPPTVVNNVPPPPPKPMPPMIVNNNVADDCDCDDCGCNGGGNAEFVQQDVEYVSQPAVAYRPIGTTSFVEDVDYDLDDNDGVMFGGQSVVYP